MNIRGFSILILGIVLLTMMSDPVPASARSTVAVQEIRGYIGLKDGPTVYKIPNLKRGEVIYVYGNGISGDFDPLVALLKPSVPFETVLNEVIPRLNSVLKEGQDPLVVIPEALNEVSLVWNDDYGKSYSAGLRYRVEKSGDYEFLVGSTIQRATSGRFRLLVGVNAPNVLSGKARARGRPFVLAVKSAPFAGERASEAEGSISKGKSFRFYPLEDIRSGETLYLRVEATSGSLKPVITLYDFADKPIKNANFAGQESKAVMQYTFDKPARHYRIRVSGRQPNGTVTEGTYRLFVGIGVPEILSGEKPPAVRSALKEPIRVKIGLKMQQITTVDQKAENFGVVATLMMKWHDPALAFNPDKIEQRLKLYPGESFSHEMSSRAIPWPDFTIYNQQGNRWVQNRAAAVFSDGSAIYLERFSTLLQAPDFDFRRFPFDTQKFFIRVDCLNPEWIFVFEPMEGYSEAGKQLGEEEWVVTAFDASIATSDFAERPVSRFNFRFDAKRHLEYYIIRIFLPILIILTVSWVLFFLKDYGKRIEVAGANLLLFIAFNFTISSDLPRLGYITFMDAILISAFIVTALVLILSVVLQRLAADNKETLARRIDTYVVRWLYPAAYVGAVLLVYHLFG
ncbi:MAG: hypothetical protein ACM3ON_01570 [Chloroflexota bacterium]